MKAHTLLPEKLVHQQELRAVALIVATCALYWLIDARVAGLPISTAFFGLAAVMAARVVARPRTWLDLILVSWTFGVAWLLLTAEALSLARLLGSPMAWVVGAGAWAVGWLLVGQRVAGQRYQRRWPRRPAGLDLGVPWWALPWPIAFGLLLATAFVLTWFAGINIYDSVSTYLPRSVRYLQNGTLNVYATFFDSTPYLHQMLVAHQLVFLRSDVLVNVLSFVTAGLIGVGIYAFVRSLGWRGWRPLAAACLPFTMPEFLMVASSSNFDIHEALWLLLGLYFLRRAAPAAQPRWLICAAVATGLAVATKPTFWFAAPGLGLVWLAVLARFVAKRGWRRVVLPLAWCGGIVVAVGTPYLIRNLLLRGSPLGTESVNEYVMGPPLSVVDRLRLVLFNELAIWTQLLTPPALFGRLADEPVNTWFKGLATALGYSLPDPRWSFYPSWDGLLRHGLERYNLGHASFGAAFVLVVVPALVALVVTWRGLGPRRLILAGCVGFALAYIAALAGLFRFDLHVGRYLIEPVVVLAVVVPVLLWALPKRVTALYSVVVASVLLYEMQDVIVRNRQMPAASVTTVPRAEQFYLYFGQSRPTLAAIRAFEWKYPREQYPEVYVDHRGNPNFPDYGFLGASLARTLHYWSPLSADPPIPPGVFLTNDVDLIRRLSARTEVLIDRLSLDTWAVVPVDQPRVVFDVRKPLASGPLQLEIRAAVPPARFSQPEYRFTLACGTGECVARDFSPEPTAVVPIETPGVVKIEARQAGSSEPPLVLYIEPARYLGL